MQPELQLFGLHGAGQAQTLKAKCDRFRFRVWGLSPRQHHSPKGSTSFFAIRILRVSSETVERQLHASGVAPGFVHLCQGNARKPAPRGHQVILGVNPAQALTDAMTESTLSPL